MTGVTIYCKLLRSITQLMLFQHDYCTFVIILFGPFIRLFIKLTMCIRALSSISATTLGLVERAFWRVPLYTEWIGASSFEVILAGPPRHSTIGTFHWDFGLSTHFSHSAAWKILETNSAVSFLHAYWCRDGSSFLVESTHRWLHLANNLQEFFVHAVLSPDSWLRRFFHNFHFWHQNSYFVNLARYFFSQLLFNLW